MLFPIIRIREKGEKGKGRIIGTNSHDMLRLDEHGNIAYHNLQCCEGTGEDGCYEFVGERDEMYGVTIEFVTFEELVEIYKSEVKELCEDEHMLVNLALAFRDEQIKKNGLDKDTGVSNSAGNLI